MNPIEEYAKEFDKEWADGLARLVPEHMRAAIVKYMLRGEHVGHFLTALLTNDLMETLARADPVNRDALPDYVSFLYNYAPPASHGSVANFRAWIKKGGAHGKGET